MSVPRCTQSENVSSAELCGGKVVASGLLTAFLMMATVLLAFFAFSLSEIVGHKTLR